MRISPTPAVSLVAGHAALKATHGVTGDIVGTSDSQRFTNKIFRDELLVETLPSGSGAVLSPKVTLKGGFDATPLQMSLQQAAVSAVSYYLNFLDKDGVAKAYLNQAGFFTIVGNLEVQAGRAYKAILTHAMTANRTVTLQNKDVTVAGLDDIQHVQDISFNDTEISAGTPILSNETGQDQLSSEWDFNAVNERIRAKVSSHPPSGFNKLKIQIVAKATTTATLRFQHSLNAGAVADLNDVSVTTSQLVFHSTEIDVVDGNSIRVMIKHQAGNVSLYLYSLKLIWYK